MATVNKDFKVKNGLVVEGSTATVNGHDVLTESLVDAKGDLLVGTADNTITRLAAGSNGYILTADSSTTEGIKWAAAPAVGTFDSSITFEGATANDYETTVQVADPTADRTITLPDATGTVVLRDTTDTLSNKTISYTNNTITVQVANISDLTANASELNTLDGITASTAELNLLDGVTASTAELNILDGVTASASELNILDGATLSVTELNYVDGVTSGIQSQLDGKASSGDLTTHTGATEAHGATGAVVGTTNTQTLSNKTLTSPIVSGLTISDGSIVVEGATANDFETTIQITDPTADRTITLPDATGTVALSENVLALSGGTMSGAIAMGTNKITGLGTPTDAADAVTKGYVDSVAEGLHIHESVIAATTANVNLANALENGDTLDGITLATGNRILVKNQTTTSENGIYVVQASGQPVRATDFDTATEVDSGDFVFVYSGTVNAGTGWVQTNKPATIGTDPIVFTQFSGAGTYVAGNGLTLTGNSFSIDTSVTANLSGAQTLTNKTIDGASNTLTVRIANDVSGLGAGVATFLGTPSSANLASAVTDETGSGALVFANTPTLVTPELGAATGTSIAFPDAFAGSATGTAGTAATTIDTWSATTYSAAKYFVQMKKDNDIEVIEMLVAVDGNNNVYVTEYGNVVSNTELGTTNAVYSGGNVLLQVTAAAAGTSVKVSKTYIEA